jgi:5-methylcytosine-specific restriction endonuclease McrA
MRTKEQRHAEYLKYRDKCIAREQRYRDENPEKMRARDRARYTPERKAAIIARTAKRRAENPGCRKESERRYRERHKEAIAAYNRKYFKEHPDVVRSSQHRRRAQKYLAPFDHFRSLEIYERDKWMCGLCGEPVNKELHHRDPMSPSLDHIIPLAKGGHHLRSNCQLAHLSCNKKKNCFD